MKLTIPAVIQAAIERGAAVALSVSAGKDSQARERALSSLHDTNTCPRSFFAIPAGILSAGFMEEFRKRRVNKTHRCPHCGESIEMDDTHQENH